MNICVYSSSSEKLHDKYYDAASEIGKKMAQRGDTLVFGAGMVGTMGAMARAVKSGNGKIIGVIPKVLNKKGIVYEFCDELYETPDMRSRKKLLEENADAFVALPGGFGTFEELLEIITGKQLGYHDKPIVIFNLDGYYDALLEQFEQCYEQNFTKKIFSELYFIANNIDAIFEYIDNYSQFTMEDKWS